MPVCKLWEHAVGDAGAYASRTCTWLKPGLPKILQALEVCLRSGSKRWVHLLSHPQSLCNSFKVRAILLLLIYEAAQPEIYFCVA